MRRSNLYVVFSLVLCFGFISAARAQQVFKTTSTSVIGYLEYLPQDYHSNSNKYPVMIFLHGIGERGANSTDPAVISTTIQNVAKLGPPMYAKNGTQFPFILISPQLKNNYGTWPATYVMEVINHVKSYLRIDEKRIYLTGLSLGGGGVWMTAQDYSALFAAIAPVCGGYNTLSKACSIAGENLPVWALHGDKDTIVPLSRTTSMVNAINNCTPKPSPLAKVTIYTGVAHNAWDKAYKTDNTVHNPNVYQWMLSYTNTVNKGNKIPTANAGADQTRTLASSLTLSGSGADTDGSIVSYTWKQISGPNNSILANAGSPTVTLSSLVAGVYTFRLQVKDNSGNTDTDYVKLTVQSGTSTTNVLPVANAGPDKNLTLPSNAVSLYGTGTDSDGSIAAYGWTKISGGTATMNGTSSATLSLSGLVSGAYVFRLTVTDNKGGKKSDDVSVNVTSTTTTNIAPVAIAGSDKSLTQPASSVVLYGNGTDADGTIASYKWVKIYGPSCSYSGNTTKTLNVTNLATVGKYIFRLTVTDNKGATSYDDVIINVSSSSLTSTTPIDPGMISIDDPSLETEIAQGDLGENNVTILIEDVE